MTGVQTCALPIFVLHNYADVKEGDVIEVYDTRQVERTLS